MKVTVPEHQSKTTLSALLLELQLTNELAQLSSAISVYQELIAFCLQYAFLFKNEDSTPIGELFSQNQERLSTPAPARDGTNWVVYCAATPVGRWDPSGCYSQEYYEHVLHGNADNYYNGTVEREQKDRIVQNAAGNLASKGQSKIAAKDIYYGNQKMTQALSVAAVGNTQYLDDKTNQSLQGKSAAEIEATLDQVTYVFGVSQADGKFTLTGQFTETNKYLAGHELIHQLQSQAWGGPSSFLAEYNRQYNSNWLANSGEKDIYTRLTKSYVSIGFEIDAYTFGPANKQAKTRIQKADGSFDYIRW